MFQEIGAFDAKAKLSELLREVREGKRYTITVRGEPVADLVPAGSHAASNASAAVAAMRAFPKVRGVSGSKLIDWVAEGRR